VVRHARWLVPCYVLVALLAFLLASTAHTTSRIVAPRTTARLSSAPVLADTTREDLVTVAFGEHYTWPSGLTIVVAAPTAGDVARTGTVVVRTTLTNNTGAPYDVGRLIGPSVRYGDSIASRSVTVVDRTARGSSTIVPPGERFTLEHEFSPGTGPLRIKYRDGLLYSAVVFVG
jgi:hypothetical protein